jgi:hypothetical protein
MLITTSGMSNTFCKVCLVELSLTLLAGEKTAMGGFDETKLKKLYGLKLTIPCESMVDAKQMGRGAIAC